MLQESKKQRVDRTFFCSFWGGRNKDWVFSLAEGSVGGMVIGWKSNLFEVWAVEASIFSLSSILSKRDLNLSWWLSDIYVPSRKRGKEYFWIELYDLGNLVDVVWCVGGDLVTFFTPKMGIGLLPPLIKWPIFMLVLLTFRSIIHTSYGPTSVPMPRAVSLIEFCLLYLVRQIPSSFKGFA